MRGGLDETLDRMRRREEALRRRSTDPAGTADDQVGPPEKTGPTPGTGVSRVESRNAGPGWGTAREAQPRHVLEDVAEALRAAVALHPGTSVAARIDHDGQAYDLRVAWTGQEVTVTGQPVAAPPAWPISATAEPGWSTREDNPDPAARLAELIRRDPSLLTGEEPTG
ncbi:hypothetical protein E0H26_06425 [Micromonospora zingiberis]|uniref:Uncharacterized protein n=1 Tax=Micromonospora zingiberis TaxID=2053011 RepID=A0A4R0GQ25_9ACTN|nr:hypothetical protein [Micromonospora zingiberis]TCB99037.1 hypothetical protein E0H26_06425 [Micromonospora zingiberis]